MNNYFPHDSNARNSDKLIPLRARFGAEGYGIYFMLIERLREESSYMSVKDYNMLAFDLRVDAGKVKSVIEDFGLFAFADNGKCFYSESLMRRMKVKDEKSEKARQSAKSRWNKSERNANAPESECECIANAPESECECIANAPESDANKVKESKDNIKLSNTTLTTRTREEILLETFDGYVREVLDGQHEVWVNQVKKKFHIGDMPAAIAKYRDYAIEMTLFEEIQDLKGFKKFFVWRAGEFLKENNNEIDKNNTGNGRKGIASKLPPEPGCGLIL